MEYLQSCQMQNASERTVNMNIASSSVRRKSSAVEEPGKEVLIS